MSLLWLFLIIPASTFLGFLLCAIIANGQRADKKIESMQEITDKKEAVIEAFLRYGYVEDSRAENDYDLNIGKVGTEKIQKILEGI